MYLFIRMFKVFFLGVFAKKKVHFLDKIKTSLRCWPNDLDTNLHMNNGRYLTLLDLGRFDLILRSGFYKSCLKKSLSAVLAGATIQFRKSLHPFQRFYIITQVKCWDERWFYIEQVIYNAKDEFVASALLRAVFLQNKRPVPTDKILDLIGVESKSSPPFPERLKHWIKGEAFVHKNILK